ncbi:hypothetical protein KUV86_00535 [Halomonas sp. DP8Y7-3]|uniref:hypothetical protein n=1 Tax=Halomonas sp. DP8Y7-3 TaxID=2859079 RepID=UPI001C983145|nr:hypothetical protein [Halomonas sp. DP8Y7-3]MBY5927596.1 hypothetical protein [Halomonas sp. DP8Y7-3]
MSSAEFDFIRTLIEEVPPCELATKAREVVNSQSACLFGKNPRSSSVRFAREQALARRETTKNKGIYAFGMNELINALKTYKDDDLVSYYYVKSKNFAGEIYVKGSALVGFQFVERKCEKYSKGYDSSIVP